MPHEQFGELTVRWSHRGTHLGTSRSGIAPTGKIVDIGSILCEIRIEGNLIVEVWERGAFVDLRDVARDAQR